MATITVPDFSPHPLQDVAQPGTVLTEPELLGRLHAMLPPLQILASLLHGAVERQEVTTLVIEPMLSVIFQALYEPVILLETWAEASREERLDAAWLQGKRHHEETSA